MRKGYRILIVAVVAIGTNLGLHAAFGWCGHGHWRSHHGHYYHHHGCNENQGGCANPWGYGNDQGVKDSIRTK